MAEKPSQADIVSQFEAYKAEWERETMFSSSERQNLREPSFRAIIAMGAEVIPLLLKNVDQSPSWMMGLIEITGENPVQEGDTYEQAIERWTTWGREHDYIKDEVEEPGITEEY